VLTEFWKAVGGKLADRFAAVAVPALVFWLGGLAAWTVHRGSLAAVTRQLGWLDRQGAGVQVAVLLTVLLAVAGSGVVVGGLAAPVLRLLEGYWPRWADPLRLRLARRLAERAAAEAPAWQKAYERVQPPADPTAEDLAVYARLERRRRRRPSSPGYFLPTPIGNILRAAERRPFDKYGLDAIVVWPRLWPMLPETLRSDLLAARTSLDRAAIVGVWGVLFCAFAPLTLWVIPIGLGVAATAVAVVVPGRAQAFGELMEAAYDQYRTTLYTQLRWPLPANPHQERAEGHRLTSYLWRGSDDMSPAFIPSGEAAPERDRGGAEPDLVKGPVPGHFPADDGTPGTGVEHRASASRGADLGPAAPGVGGAGDGVQLAAGVKTVFPISHTGLLVSVPVSLMFVRGSPPAAT
jgi:hypothetical protein